MKVRIRSSFKRRILILVAAGLIAGLIYPALSDESYDAVRNFGEYRNVMSARGFAVVSDIIADNSNQVDLTRFLTGRGSDGRQQLAGPDHNDRPDLKDCNVLILNLCVFLLYVLLGTSLFSFKHISYIHLKDGNK